MSIRAVLFDLDGTVLNTLEDLAASTNAALRAHSFPTRTTEEVRRFVGNGIAKLIERALPAGTDAAICDAVLAEFKQHYAEHCAVNTRPYEGILPMLQALKDAGLRLGLVSNKADFAVQELSNVYFPGLFDAVTGEKSGIPRKPAPDMVHNTLRALEINTSDAVFVGDSDVDVLTAKNAATKGIFVTWGFRDAACLKATGATTLADTPGELLQLLLAL